MDSEDDFFRPSSKFSYQPTNIRLSLPTEAVEATLNLLRKAGRRESGLFWYGPRDEAGNGTVAYVIAPRQRMFWGNYHVSAQHLAEIVHHLRDDWKPLVQVHSHPGVRVEHSNYDDSMVSSRRILSVVFPSYGRGSESFPDGIGVHEWQNDYWHLLDPASVRRRIILTDGAAQVEDLR